ncbi:nuclear transport factor 2 family protein [Pseudomonas sp. GCM10022186]|uniref:nuclear transport factor 2 family protein n=1 Tax=Pseudomonas sp. GCM10022186 TaxID=3252650 RepID=UPI003612A0AD
MDSPLADLRLRLETLEAESAIRRLLARYMDLCDVPREMTSASELAELFTENAIWEGVGSHYAQKFGRQQGRAEVAAFVAAYLPPSPHFAVNLHLLTSESIRVAGEEASGQWIMQQISTYGDRRSELISARLNIDFRRVAGSWQMAHFRTCRMFSAALGEACR